MSLLRKSALAAFVPDSTTGFTSTFADHLDRATENIVAHASELAHHCGRQRVQRHDVAQAMSTLCLMCDPYTIGPNGKPVCNTLSTAKTVGGGPQYEGYCDGKVGQCGTPYGTCGSLAGGGRTRRASKTQTSRVRKTKCARCGRRHGGMIIPSYTGYCHSHPSQCTFGDAAAAAVACAQDGGRTRKTGKTSRVRKTKCARCRRHGGMIIPSYTGYCHSHPSQCTFGDAAAAAVACAQDGGKTRRRGGQAVADTMSLVIKTAVRAYGKDNYGVQWPADALRLLERGLAFHAQQVLTDTKADEYYASAPETALDRTLQAVV